MFKCLRVWGTFHLSHHSDDAGFGDGGDGDDDDDHDGERCRVVAIVTMERIGNMANASR